MPTQGIVFWASLLEGFAAFSPSQCALQRETIPRVGHRAIYRCIVRFAYVSEWTKVEAGHEPVSGSTRQAVRSVDK